MNRILCEEELTAANARIQVLMEALEDIGPHKGKRSCRGLPTCPWCVAKAALAHTPTPECPKCGHPRNFHENGNCDYCYPDTSKGRRIGGQSLTACDCDYYTPESPRGET